MVLVDASSPGITSRHARGAIRRLLMASGRGTGDHLLHRFQRSSIMRSWNPLEPVGAIIKAVTFPFTAIFVVGLCYFINWFTSPHHWWAQWVLFGMVIATLSVWMRAFRVIVETIGIAGAGYLIYRWWNNRRSKTTATGTTIDSGTC